MFFYCCMFVFIVFIPLVLFFGTCLCFHYICINIKIKAGEVIGISGKSGSGKTTFIDLLLGLLDLPKQDVASFSIDDKTPNDKGMYYCPVLV